MYHQLHPE
jgi:hypothetical protein